MPKPKLMTASRVNEPLVVDDVGRRGPSTDAEYPIGPHVLR